MWPAHTGLAHTVGHAPVGWFQGLGVLHCPRSPTPVTRGLWVGLLPALLFLMSLLLLLLLSPWPWHHPSSQTNQHLVLFNSSGCFGSCRDSWVAQWLLLLMFMLLLLLLSPRP
jgi:hypothetical protein